MSKRSARRGHRNQPHLPARCVLRSLVGVHPGEEHVYEASVRVTKPSRFFVLDAEAFADFMKTEFPMAVHLLEGHMVGGLRQRQIIGQREKLLALGTVVGRLTHQLNNPAAATARAVADLRERVGRMRHKLAMLADGKFTPEALRVLVSIQDEVAEQVAQVQVAGTDRAGNLRPRGADRRLARGSRHRRAPGTTRRRSSTPGWTSTGSNASRRPSTRSTRRRRCRAPSAGCATPSRPSC